MVDLRERQLSALGGAAELEIEDEEVAGCVDADANAESKKLNRTSRMFMESANEHWAKTSKASGLTMQ